MWFFDIMNFLKSKILSTKIKKKKESITGRNLYKISNVFLWPRKQALDFLLVTHWP